MREDLGTIKECLLLGLSLAVISSPIVVLAVTLHYLGVSP